jgi:hypothetical protein
VTDDSRLIVPPLDAEPWPTLGPEVCDWLEDHLCYGPGGMLGEPIELIDEIRLFIYRAYEVYPRGHELAGRRRFKRVVLSRRKGVGKTEILSWLSIAEMDPTAPVRCDGWHVDRGDWVPVGRPVLDPYIPMRRDDARAVRGARLRRRQEDPRDLCLRRRELRVHRRADRPLDAPGVIKALASAPSGRDGARTSFQHFDETHLFIEERLRGAHATMLRNVPKRKDADAWSLSTTTMYAPGEDSIAEREHAYAKAMQRGNASPAARSSSALLFDHRQASERHKIFIERGRTSVVNKKALEAAVREASGDAWPYTDLPSITAQLQDPTADEAEFRRYWLNQPRKPAKKWLSRELLERRVDAGRKGRRRRSRRPLLRRVLQPRLDRAVGATVSRGRTSSSSRPGRSPLGPGPRLAHSAQRCRPGRRGRDEPLRRRRARARPARLASRDRGLGGDLRRDRRALRDQPAEALRTRLRRLRASRQGRRVHDRRGSRMARGPARPLRALHPCQPPRLHRRHEAGARLARQDRHRGRSDRRAPPSPLASREPRRL